MVVSVHRHTWARHIYILDTPTKIQAGGGASLPLHTTLSRFPRYAPCNKLIDLPGRCQPGGIQWFCQCRWVLPAFVVSSVTEFQSCMA